MLPWVYWAGLYDSKFEAYCAVMWVEGDKRIYGSKPPCEVELYKTKKGKFGVRFRTNEC